MFKTTDLLVTRHTIKACPITEAEEVLGSVLVQELSQLLEATKVLTRSNMRVRDYTDCRHSRVPGLTIDHTSTRANGAVVRLELNTCLCHHVKGSVNVGLPPYRCTLHGLLMHPQLPYTRGNDALGTTSTGSPRGIQSSTLGGDTHTGRHMKHTILGVESHHQLLLTGI